MRKAEQASQTPGFRQANDVFQTPQINFQDQPKLMIAKKDKP